MHIETENQQLLKQPWSIRSSSYSEQSSPINNNSRHFYIATHDQYSIQLQSVIQEQLLFQKWPLTKSNSRTKCTLKLRINSNLKQPWSIRSSSYSELSTQNNNNRRHFYISTHYQYSIQLQSVIQEQLLFQKWPLTKSSSRTKCTLKLRINSYLNQPWSIRSSSYQNTHLQSITTDATFTSLLTISTRSKFNQLFRNSFYSKSDR